MTQICSRLAAGFTPLLSLSLMACPGPADSGLPGDSQPSVSYTGPRPEACDRYSTLGSFGIELMSAGAGFSGVLLDSPSPFTTQELVSAGECRLYGWEHQPHCDPPCEGETICAYDDTCRAWPANLSVGTLRLLGTEPELELEPTEWGSYTYTEAWPTPYAPGAQLTLQAQGAGQVDAFTLTLAGSPLLEQERIELTMRPGQPLIIPWDPPEGPEGMRMRVRLSIDHHASTPGYAACDAPAGQGSVTVSSAIVDGLIAAGATGIGTYVESSSLTLASEAWADTSSGCIVFETASSQHFDVGTEL